MVITTSAARMLSSVHGFGELAGDVDVALGHRGNGRGVDLVARLGVTRPRDGAIAREVLEETRAPSGCGPRCAHTGTPRWACRRGCGPPRGPAAAGSSARCCARRTGRNWCAGIVDGLGAEHPVEFLLQPVGGLVAETFVGRCRTPRTQGRQAAAPGRRGGSASVTTTSRAGGRRRPRAGAPARGVGCPRRPGSCCGASTAPRPTGSAPSCGCTRTPPEAPFAGRRG